MKIFKLYLKLSAILVFIIPILLHISSHSCGFSIYAQSIDQCAKQLDKAEHDYDTGNFQEALGLIEACINKPGISKPEIARAYRLLGLVYIGQQLQKEANDAVKKLLLVVPNYKVNPKTDSPQFQKIIEETAATLVPFIKDINPDTVKEGDSSFTMTIKGSNFVFGSEIKLNGQSKHTTFVNAEELKTNIPAADILKSGDYIVSVYSPISGGKSSNKMKFIVQGKSNSPWTWIAIGGGAVAAAIVAIITTGTKSSTGTGQTTILADPPARP